MSNVARKTNLVAWWIGEGKNSYPSLYNVAMKYLCVQGSSVPSEQIFRYAGNITTARKNRLDPKTAEMHIFLYGNLEQ